MYARTDEELAVLRRREVGLVYQFYNLIPVLNVVENLSLIHICESLGSAIVLCVLGLVIIVHGANSTVFIGIVWGLLGLQKAART